MIEYSYDDDDISGLLKKWGVYNEKEGSTHSISTDGADHGTQKINDVCVKMIKQLFSANQVKQVGTSMIYHL